MCYIFKYCYSGALLNFICSISTIYLLKYFCFVISWILFPVLYLHRNILFCFPFKCNFIILWLESLIFSDKHLVWWNNSMCFKIIRYLQISKIVSSGRIKTECWNRYDNWLFTGYWLLFMKNIYCIKGSYLWWLFEDLSLAESRVADTNNTKTWTDTTVTGLINLEFVSFAVVYAETKSNQFC